MPQVAHDAVALGLSASSEVLAWTKAAPGLAPVAGALERPARALLGSKLGKTALLASDRVVSVADGAIDTAMGTSLFKVTARTVKTTYSSRVQPAAARMRSAYAAAARRSAAWRRQVTSEYHRILLRADGLVDAFLPPAAGGTDAVKLPSLLIKKKGVAGPATHTCSSPACHARVPLCCAVRPAADRSCCPHARVSPQQGWPAKSAGAARTALCTRPRRPRRARLRASRRRRRRCAASARTSAAWRRRVSPWLDARRRRSAMRRGPSQARRWTRGGADAWLFPPSRVLSLVLVCACAPRAYIMCVSVPVFVSVCLSVCLSNYLPACLPACLYLDIPKHPCTHHSDDHDASHARGRACRALHGGGGHRGACACDDAGWIAVGVCSYCSSPSLCRGRVPRAGETPAHAHALVREGESERNRCTRV